MEGVLKTGALRHNGYVLEHQTPYSGISNGVVESMQEVTLSTGCGEKKHPPPYKNLIIFRIIGNFLVKFSEVIRETFSH